jgi:hypothetical protein
LVDELDDCRIVQVKARKLLHRGDDLFVLHVELDVVDTEVTSVGVWGEVIILSTLSDLQPADQLNSE